MLQLSKCVEFAVVLCVKKSGLYCYFYPSRFLAILFEALMKILLLEKIDYHV